MAIWKLPADVTTWVERLAAQLDGRLAHRLTTAFLGVLFARGRRTVTSWLRAGGVGADFPEYYYFLGSLGRRTASIGMALVCLAVKAIAPGDRLLLALDDTPTKRYGPKVQGAGVHHNPTPGPADHKFVYGHVWVVLAWVVRHPRWSAIGLPLRAVMYIRQKDLGTLPRATRKVVPFRTKLTMAADLITWAANILHWLGRSVWVVADGAYGKKPVLRAATANGVVVVSRLRKDAKLFDVPKPPTRRGRGRPRTYGDRISLAKRGAHRHGWTTGPFRLYGRDRTKTYKTFVATYPPAGGAIRVVIVREDHAWLAFFATDVNATVTQILEAVADRFAIEQTFHDLKEVYGAGQQQLRNYWANVAAFHVNLWMMTLVELWAWARRPAELTDRTASPWDDAGRRPSHADRRNALRRQCVQQQYHAATAGERLNRKCRALLDAALQLAT
jgi:DDE superfamily endonuclease